MPREGSSNGDGKMDCRQRRRAHLDQLFRFRDQQRGRRQCHPRGRQHCRHQPDRQQFEPRHVRGCDVSRSAPGVRSARPRCSRSTSIRSTRTARPMATGASQAPRRARRHRNISPGSAFSFLRSHKRNKGISSDPTARRSSSRRASSNSSSTTDRGRRSPRAATRFTTAPITARSRDGVLHREKQYERAARFRP